MSEPTKKDDAPEPFNALSFESPHDPGTLSLSDSEPALSDSAEVESVSDEEEEDDEDSGQQGVQESPLHPFSLKGMDAGFSQRSSGIFGALLDIQKVSPLTQENIKGKQGVTASLTPEAPDSKPPEQKEKTNTGSSSVTTKKRSAPASRLPDYLAHPERWTKYNLEDVPDTSERDNRNTAINFLVELKQQKEAAKGVSKDTTNPVAYNQDSSSSGEGRILFSKPPKRNQKDSEKSGALSGLEKMARSWGDDGLEDSEVYGEQEKPESLGFHGAKKRSRKNIRQKADDKEEDSS